MKLLTVSDVELPIIYSDKIKKRFKDIDLAISCGDLSYYYLEYIISSLDIPLYFVRGNHAKPVEYGSAGPRTYPWGAINLHKKTIQDPTSGLLMAGLEGSIRYNSGKYQYSQTRMWSMAFQLAPALMFNKLRYGRFLDILVTHASPWQIHDEDDLPHQGFKAFNWLIKTFQPTYHLHGHIHVYMPTTVIETHVKNTIVLNTFGYRKLIWPVPVEWQTATE